VRGAVPWTAEAPRHAGTVHLGGTLAEIAEAERDAVAGRMPERPFVLVGQQYLADPGRSVGDVHPLYAYAHVPFAHEDVDGARAAILAQLERFAPGVTDRVVDAVVTGPADFAAADPNMVGGDILAGAKTPLSLLLGPRGGADPYRTGRPGTYLCSAATPPGPGAHGMGGWHAAHRALADLRLPARPLQEVS
jgi:phytoene dehydrogenase-like protein